MNQMFNLTDQVVMITGGCGLLGRVFCKAIIEAGGNPVVLDISGEALKSTNQFFLENYQKDIDCLLCDITNKEDIIRVKDVIMEKYGHIDALINNAANNPKVEGGSKNLAATRFTDFPVEIWNADFAVGLTGAMLCAQVFGGVMEQQEKGVIINISSDYGIISPDQRVYRKEGVPEEEQIIKPVSYSVVKHGMMGLTKYLATYWAKKGIRVNTLCPASLSNGQDEEFVKKLSNLVPMGRMSNPDEYEGTIVYMLSDASTYMTGATVVLDGGRTIW